MTENKPFLMKKACLLYTSDAADEGLGVDLGGRRIIKKNIRNTARRALKFFLVETPTF